MSDNYYIDGHLGKSPGFLKDLSTYECAWNLVLTQIPSSVRQPLTRLKICTISLGKNPSICQMTSSLPNSLPLVQGREQRLHMRGMGGKSFQKTTESYSGASKIPSPKQTYSLEKTKFRHLGYWILILSNKYSRKKSHMDSTPVGRMGNKHFQAYYAF